MSSAVTMYAIDQIACFFILGIYDHHVVMYMAFYQDILGNQCDIHENRGFWTASVFKISQPFKQGLKSADPPAGLFLFKNQSVVQNSHQLKSICLSLWHSYFTV